jgi:hypothetical protein
MGRRSSASDHAGKFESRIEGGALAPAAGRPVPRATPGSPWLSINAAKRDHRVAAAGLVYRGVRAPAIRRERPLESTGELEGNQNT